MTQSPAAQAIWIKERSPADSANCPISHLPLVESVYKVGQKTDSSAGPEIRGAQSSPSASTLALKILWLNCSSALQIKGVSF